MLLDFVDDELTYGTDGHFVEYGEQILVVGLVSGFDDDIDGVVGVLNLAQAFLYSAWLAASCLGSPEKRLWNSLLRA